MKSRKTRNEKCYFTNSKRIIFLVLLDFDENQKFVIFEFRIPNEFYK
jgi:hypothetical protein